MKPYIGQKLKGQVIDLTYITIQLAEGKFANDKNKQNHQKI